MSKQKNYRRRQRGITPITTPRSSPGVAQFSMSEVAQFSVSLDNGINDGDLMVIDRSVEPCSGHVVVVAHQGSFLMRPLLRQGEQWLLEPVRPGEVAIPLDLEVFDRSGLFGVVVHAVHHLNKPRLRKI